MTRLRAAAAWILVIVVACAAGWWAGRATFVPPQADPVTTTPVTVTASAATVGSSIQLTAVADWVSMPLATGDRDGKVTSILHIDGDAVDQGSVLFTVDLVPVVVAEGAVPAFRTLELGMTGADVAQLQQLLADLGFLTPTPDGHLRTSTVAAIERWQASLGMEQTGSVALGDVIFVPELPARIMLEETVQLGATLAAGDQVARRLDAAPQFTVSLEPDQRSFEPRAGDVVRIDLGDGPVDAVIDSLTTNDSGTLVLELGAADGGPVCGAPCSAVPFGADPRSFSVTLLLAPEVTGPSVPVSALGTAGDGSTFVVAQDGTRRTVTVLGADASRAVVDGLEIGEVVDLFAVADPGLGGASDGSATANSTATATTSGESSP